MEDELKPANTKPEEAERGAAEAKPPFRERLSRGLQGSVSLLKRLGKELAVFGSLAWVGAAIASVISVLAFMSYIGSNLRTGLGTPADVAVSNLLGAIGVALAGLLIMLVATILRALPRLFAGAFLGAFVFLVALFSFYGAPIGLPMRMGSALILVYAGMGGALGVLLRPAGQRAGASLRVLAGALLVIALAAAFALGAWVLSRGNDPYLEDQTPAAPVNVTPLDTANPAEQGSYRVATLTYGGGTDKHRPEYGKLVSLKTHAVDASPFVKNLRGLKAKLRKWYWGFGPEQSPLNARVWYPEAKGPFPLVLIVHGNHQMEEFSDPGYAYLGELLASRGFITVSVDENFLNVSWSGDIGGENGARGWLLLKHLELWRNWNATAGNPFYGKVDLSRIALIGHSRGGEAVTHAAAFNRLRYFPDDANIRFDFHFAIRSLVAIAPIDGQYEPAKQAPPLENVNYLVLQGSHDSDLFFFAGNRPYRRLKFTDGQDWMKAAVYIYRANHGQFNTVWGRYDQGPPLDRFLNQAPLLSGEEQRQIARVYIAAFLEATLRGRREYVPMFQNPRVITRWLPKTIYFNQFEDSSFRVVSDFDEGIDLSRATVPGGTQLGENLLVWRLEDHRGRGRNWSFRNRVTVLGWDNRENKGAAASGGSLPSYSIALPDGLARQWQLNAQAKLVFSVADSDEDPHESNLRGKQGSGERPKKKQPLDFTIELVGAKGLVARIALSQFAPLQPVLKVKFTKWNYLERELYNKPTEPVLQTYEVPLGAFAAAESRFDPLSLKTIRFRFDRSASGVLLLDEVGFATKSSSIGASRGD